MDTLPDTSNYMILGYAIAFITMGIYLFSMYMRNANLKRDLEMLESMEKENSSKK